MANGQKAQHAYAMYTAAVPADLARRRDALPHLGLDTGQQGAVTTQIVGRHEPVDECAPRGNSGTCTHRPSGTILAVAGAITIGRTGNDRVIVSVEARAHPGAEDYWDGNWMISPISVHVGGFTAEIAATLRMDEIHRFNEGLKYINQNLAGTAVLASMELWIELTVRCEPNGHLSVLGDVIENPATKTHLEFEIGDLDQTMLPGWIASLDAIEREFPVLGRP